MTSKRILLVSPEQNHPTNNKRMYPSGALLLIGTMCKNEGHEVILFEDSIDNNFLELLYLFDPNIVGVTINTFQTKYAKQYVDIVKSWSSSITVIGGPHVSAIGYQALKEFTADIAVIGEGEFTFMDIVNDVPLDKIKGIYYGDTQTEPRPCSETLDHIPLTDLCLARGQYENPNSMFIMASRDT